MDILEEEARAELSEISRVQKIESEILTKNYKVLPGFNESKYTKEYEELDKEALLSKDMSYIPNFVEPPKSLSSSEIAAEAEYQMLLKGENGSSMMP